MYNDPSGEFIGVVLAIVTSKLFIVGAAVGAATYLITSAIKGTPITLKGFLGSAIKTGLSFYLGGLMNPEAFSLSMGELLLRGADHVVASILPSLDINIGDFSFSISPSIAIGKGWGFGANVSASFHIGDFTISRGFGIMNYGYHAGSGEKGWEYRNSEMFTYDDGKFGVSLGTNIWSGLHEQQTGIIGLRHGDFSMSYENDGAPFGHTLGDNNDSYRTAAMRFGIGDFSAGFNLFTGVRLESSYEDKGGADKYTMEKYSSNRKKGFFNRLFSPIPIGEVINGVNYPFGLVQEIGTKYRLGAAYIGWRNYRVGIDSDRHVRYPIQVIGAHYFASPQPGQQVIQNKPEEIIKYYFQYHTKNKFTSW